MNLLISTASSFALFSLLYTLSAALLVPFIVSAVLGVCFFVYLEFKSSLRFAATPKHRGDSSVLITGTTHGIGYELAKIFARDGFNVIMVARNLEKLIATAKELNQINPSIKIHCIPKDLTKKGACEEVFEKATGIPGFKVTYLVNNAGFGQWGEFVDVGQKIAEQMVDLNIMAPLRLTHMFGKWMKSNNIKAGSNKESYGILNVSSIAGFFPYPYMTTYGATKAFLQSWSLALHEELKPYGVMVTALCPGLTLTPFLPHAGLLDTLQTKLFRWGTPEEAARVGYRALMLGNRFTVVGLPNYIQAYLTSIAPYFILGPLTKWMGSKRTEMPKEEFAEYLQKTEDSKVLFPTEQNGSDMKLSPQITTSIGFSAPPGKSPMTPLSPMPPLIKVSSPS